VFIYGVISYSASGLAETTYVCISTGSFFEFFSIFDDKFLILAEISQDSKIRGRDIVLTAGAAVIIGCIVSYSNTYGLISRYLGIISRSKRTNEPDMWEHIHNSPAFSEWVTVRHSNGKIYQGCVRGYSVGEDERELLLGDVDIFVLTDDGDVKKVGEVPMLYLGLDRKDIIVELMGAQGQ